MGSYLLRRLMLVVPTLIGIITLNFFIVQLAPGGPVDQVVAALTGQDTGGASSRIAGAQSGSMLASDTDSMSSQFAGAQGLDPDVDSGPR